MMNTNVLSRPFRLLQRFTEQGEKTRRRSRRITGIAGIPAAIQELDSRLLLTSVFVTSPAGGGASINNDQPTLALHEIIALTGAYPTQNGTGVSNDGKQLVGEIRTIAGTFAPNGWAFADGQVLPISQYAPLFSVIGTQFGGNGFTTFALPNLGDRLAVGTGQAPGLFNVQSAHTSGADGIAMSTFNLPATDIHSAGNVSTEPQGIDQPIDNHQPYLGLTYIMNATGELRLFAGNFTPDGWIQPQGQLLQTSQYPLLFGNIGVSYGGDGQSTFQLPDLRGRTAVGIGQAGTFSPLVLGQKFGTEVVSLTEDQIPSYRLQLPSGNFTGYNGGGQSFDDRQPSFAVNYAIATTGVYPLPDSGGPLTSTVPFLGEVDAFVVPNLPQGYRPADGTTLSINQNSALFSLTGTTYQGGNGQSSFSLPDLRDRAVTEASSGRFEGEMYGEENHTITVNELVPHTYVVLAPELLPGDPNSRNITGNSAELSRGQVVTTNGNAILDQGIVYAPTSVNPDPLIGGAGVVVVHFGSDYVRINNLRPGTNYSFFGFASTFAGTVYEGDKAANQNTTPSTLTTLADAPTIGTPNSTNVTTTTANLGGNVTSDGGSPVIERGVAYALTSINPNPQIGGAGVNKVAVTGSTGSFVVGVSSLIPGAAYSFVAYATNSVGTTYTAPVSTFTTLAVAPTIITPTYANITGTSATLGGTVTSDGGSTITERGILYAPTSVNPNPQPGGTGVIAVTVSGTTGLFSTTVNGLVPVTGYSFVAYATNSIGTTYTAPVSTFTTPAMAPVVTTPTSTNITSTTALLGGNVSSDGGNTVTERGVIYAPTSINANPQMGGIGVTKVINKPAAGIFSIKVNSLVPGVVYSFVAFATNAIGTTYSTPVSTFVTNSPPSVLSLVPTTSSPASGSTAQYALTFSESVTGVTAAAFTLAESGVVGGVISVSGSGSTYLLSISGLTGNGSLRVNLTNTASIVDSGNSSLTTGATGGFLTFLQPHGPVQLTGKTLAVIGTSTADNITLDDASNLQITFNGAIFLFDPSALTAITVSGNAGDDIVIVNSLLSGTALTVDGGDGSDTVTVNPAVTSPTTLLGGTGNDTLTGGSGNDSLVGGTGVNILNGGAGNDFYGLTRRSVIGTDKDTLIDSSGMDTLSLATFTSDLMINLQTLGAQTIDAATGYQLNFQGVLESIQLGSGNDNFTGNASVGTSISGGAGNNTLTGGSGNDVLIGGADSDSLNGMGGNDSLLGGTGTNILNGGDGNDTYYLTQRKGIGTDKDTLIDSSGTDTLSMTSFTNDLTFNLQTMGAQTADAATGYQLDIQSVFETILLGSGNDNVTGNATVGTTISGGAGNNTLSGGSGNDVLFGGASNDILIGGSGSDTLLGNGGNDILIGGLGADTLIGGGGDDLLIGGTTMFDNNLPALQSIQNEWTSVNPYQTRIDHLTGTTEGGANGTSVLTSATVVNDGVKDTLTGGTESDWFWAYGLDTTDKAVGEDLN